MTYTDLMSKSWTDVNVHQPKPKEEEKKEEIDWLEVVEQTKRECKIKTKVPEVDYSIPIIHIKNYTEIV